MSFAECMQDLEATNVNAAPSAKRSRPRFIEVLKTFARMVAPRATYTRTSS
ncbi:hypothetical protein [Pseudomonas matsuisoli]|uniref:Uncharacterized protein n=1 Tax=Pseudomonas matsuisoli TaxID=1515666 RepID=A0A917UU39_9PSED|nr:hypothetical protein [Pseudomonas matsuisoli]GGJ85342.1 hypothetical protein GCM10009304_09200 [Pseudomonas matsuisoli]